MKIEEDRQMTGPELLDVADMKKGHVYRFVDSGIDMVFIRTDDGIVYLSTGNYYPLSAPDDVRYVEVDAKVVVR